jgi:hypothetical protein
MKSIIHQCLSPRWLGVGLSLAAGLAAQAQTTVSFMIDMSTDTTGSPTACYLSGSFNGWPYQTPAAALINVSGTLWSNSFAITDPPGTIEQCKFQDAAGWESINNREFVLGAAGTTQVLPLTSWNVNSTWPVPTNYATFEVDMSAQVALGDFIPGTGTITVSGDFEGWDAGLPLTNNPSLSGNATNVYSAVCPIKSFLPDTVNYKFRMNGGWESPVSTSGNNRSTTINTDYQVLPLVYYNDNSIYDLVVGSPITVTFTLVMTNGTVDQNGYAFNSSSDTLWINGDFLNNWDGGSWPGPIGNFPAAQQMIEVGLSDVYTNSFVIPVGNSIHLNYKYAIDSEDDENGFQTNHIREVRSYGPTYNMPPDVFSWSVVQPGVEPYPNPGITTTNIVEPDFGYLAIGAQSAGKLPITWLGRPGVVLQNSATLTGSWNVNGGTDGTQATNWSNAGGNTAEFFRLMKKQ